jgi:hypothetical protein
MPARPKAPLRIMVELTTTDFGDETTKYDLSKRLGLSYARIHEAIEGRSKVGRAFPGLEKRGFVKHEEIGKSRTGLAKKAYKATLKGLIYALTEEPKLWEKIDLIAQKNWELLPCIFGAWEHFKKFGCRNIVVKILKHVFEKEHDLIRILSRTNDPKKIRYFGDESFADIIYDYVFSPELTHLLTYSETERLIPTIKNDLVLCSKYNEKTEKLLEDAKALSDIVTTRLKNVHVPSITKKENVKEKEKGGEKS